MSDIHIDDFYKDAAKVLLQLYAAFPKKSTILVEDIAGPDEPDDFGLPCNRHQACFGAMLWLANAGYLDYVDTIRQEAIDQAVLSHKAFTLLTSSDDDAAPHGHIQQLRSALTSGSSTQLAIIMQYLLRQSSRYS